MLHGELLRVVRALLEQPTAPFHEDAVRNAIAAELRACVHVRVEHDAYGNMIARYQTAGATEMLDPIKALRATLEKQVATYRPFFRAM